MNLPLKRKESTEILSLRIPTAMRQNLNKVAKDNVSTPSEVVRYAIKNLLQDA